MKRAVVTGSSKGIGFETAKIFLKNNFEVIGISRSKNKDLEKNKKFIAIYEDLSKPKNVQNICSKILETGGVDILVNNAGFGQFSSLENIKEEIIIKMISLNLTNSILITKYLLPSLKKNKGHIFNISSRAGHVGYRFGTVYCASKFGLRGFSEALFDEVRNEGVRVSNISPGPVQTPFWNNLDREPEERPEAAVLPEDIAKIIYQAFQGKSAVQTEITILPQVHSLRFKKRNEK